MSASGRFPVVEADPLGIVGGGGEEECVILECPVLIEIPWELPFGMFFGGQLEAADGDAEIELGVEGFAGDGSIDVDITGFDADSFCGQSDDAFDEGFGGVSGVTEHDCFPASGFAQVVGVFVNQQLIAVIIGERGDIDT